MPQQADQLVSRSVLELHLVCAHELSCEWSLEDICTSMKPLLLFCQCQSRNKPLEQSVHPTPQLFERPLDQASVTVASNTRLEIAAANSHNLSSQCHLDNVLQGEIGQNNTFHMFLYHSPTHGSLAHRLSVGATLAKCAFAGSNCF